LQPSWTFTNARAFRSRAGISVIQPGCSERCVQPSGSSDWAGEAGTTPASARRLTISSLSSFGTTRSTPSMAATAGASTDA
jgi:hypothetical protein